MRSFETLCSSAVQSYRALTKLDLEMDQQDLVSLTVDRTMEKISDPVAVIDLVLEQPEILNWKAPDDAATRTIQGADYIKAAVRSRVEQRVLAALAA
ncbi:hypothetical protein G6L37_34635 [Agrobacterium rubi]|nr:hypothetical protein [Agrobacterium rubi]NTF23705.1 hypothetical protein [Agrobacterium rubi]